MKLFKVKAITEIIVLANNNEEAVQLAKNNIQSELDYCAYKVFSINKMEDIPEDWKSNIPYHPMGLNETRKCSEVLRSIGEVVNELKELKKEEINKDKIEVIEEKNIAEEKISNNVSKFHRGPFPDNPRFGIIPGIRI